MHTENEEKVNILLVDDRLENLISLEATLGVLGQNLVKARSGKEALRWILQLDFAVILLDVQMPDMDGFETATLIRQRDRSQHTPIIFLTALRKSDPEVFQGYTLGAVDYIIKPYKPEILKSKVRVFVDLFRMTKQVQNQAGQLKIFNEELERRAAELTTLNKELESFSYSVSHDLRAPLRSIESFSQALLEDYPDRLDATGQDYLRRIGAATKRMGQLIEDLLRLSRITRTELKREQVDLSALASEIAANLKRSQPERQVQFQIMPDLKTDGDTRLLRIVLEDLLGNAWKYTSKHEKATIEFGIMQSDTEKEKCLTIFFVRDDGAGFDMANAGKLFGAFQRLHTPSEFTGNGIGLATIQRIIHRHGGRVWAEGAVEKGATFYFTN